MQGMTSLALCDTTQIEGEVSLQKKQIESYLVACFGEEFVRNVLPLKPTEWIGDNLFKVVQLMPFEVRNILLELNAQRRHPGNVCSKLELRNCSKLDLVEIEADRNALFYENKAAFKELMRFDFQVGKEIREERERAYHLMLANIDQFILMYQDVYRTPSEFGWWETFSKDSAPLLFLIARHPNIEMVLHILKYWRRFVGDEYWADSLLKRCYPLGSGCTLAHHVARHSVSTEVIELLTSPDQVRSIMSHWAPQKQIAVARPSATTDDAMLNFTPSHYASEKIVDVQRFALSVLDSKGNSLSHDAARNKDGSFVLRYLHVAEMRMNISDVASSLYAFTYSVLQENHDGQTPLHIAAKESSLPTFLCILNLVSSVLRLQECVVLLDHPDVATCAAMNRGVDGPQILSAILFRAPSLFFSQSLLAVAIDNNNDECRDYLASYMERIDQNETKFEDDNDDLYYTEEEEDDNSCGGPSRSEDDEEDLFKQI